jgi:hypothetical protein
MVVALIFCETVATYIFSEKILIRNIVEILNGKSNLPMSTILLALTTTWDVVHVLMNIALVCIIFILKRIRQQFLKVCVSKFSL